MKVTNTINPNAAQMAGFAEPGADGPIYMLNLLKYKTKAEYSDGRETELTGREAYAVYSQGVVQLLKEFGGSLSFKATVERLTVGEVEDLWDDVAIAMYPSRDAMMQMIRSEKMREISVHRTAGLAGQLNIECVGAVGSCL